MEKKVTIINIILILAVIVGDICYLQSNNSILIKGITSAGFVLIGLINLLYAIKFKCQSKFHIMMLIGLTFAMLGDILLEIYFIVGAGLFAIGHVFYFISYCQVIKFKWIDLIAGVIIFVPAILLITLVPIFDFGGMLMQMVCVVYAIIISIMVGKAITNLLKQRTVLNILLVVGSCLFFFSDLMLLLDVFANFGQLVTVLCLATYYPAQCVLAYSMLHAKK